MGNIADFTERLVSESRATMLTNIKKETSEMLGNFLRERNERAKNTRHMLGNFLREHKQMAKEWTRTAKIFVSEVSSDARNILERFRMERCEMARGLRGDLYKAHKIWEDLSKRNYSKH